MYQCGACATALSEGDWFTCDKCGRPLGGCPSCGWVGLLDDAKNLQSCGNPDCDNFGPETEESRAADERMVASLHRQLDVLKQMTNRSGPIYEASKERSRIVNAAWRAAGRPRHVSLTLTRDGQFRYVVLSRSGGVRRAEDVSEAEWQAWCRWQEERERLFREHGWKQ